MNTRMLITWILLCYSLLLSSQSLTRKEFIKAIQAADSYFYYEQDYEMAANLYKPLADSYPENANLSAKLGTSYLNVDGRRSDALKYLKMAVLNVVKNDDEYTEFGEKAPLDTYLYIAIAYQQNDSLDKAITLFTEAKRKLSGMDIFSAEYINNQIRNCKYAKEAQKNPLRTETALLMPWLKDFPGACNPVLAKNDSVFVFTQRQKGKTRILYSYRNENWKYPVDITNQLGGIERYYSNSITADGRYLVIYLDDGDDGNLYYSQRKDSTWSKIRSIGRTINTIYWESHGFITPDGNTLFYASNQPGGRGELDIWKTQKEKDGSWRKPVNCGNVVNTPYNENTPFFNPDNNTLLFSSSGHTSIGGYDVFRSVLKNGSWSHPTGLPYPVNKTIDDSFITFNNRDTGYIVSYYDENAGYRNIYAIKMGSPVDKRITAEGIVTTQDGQAIDPGKANIIITDAHTGIPLRSIKVNDPSTYRVEVKPGELKILISRIGSKTDSINNKPKTEVTEKPRHLTDTGFFSFTVNPGDYLVYILQPGYKTDTIALNLPSVFSGNSVHINSSLVPEKVANNSFLIIKNIFFEFDSYTLDNQAISSLDMLRTILVDYQDLRIEVAGYTDSKGTPEHNLRLAEKRAGIIIDYLTKTGISPARLIKKVYGSTDFAALNTNVDGSDNPEGRKYNRRATFGIIDPGTGVTIRQETFTPRHLRHPSTFKYSVVLLKSEKELTPNIFKSLSIPVSLFINPVKTESGTVYVIGEFMNKLDAVRYSSYAKEKGFKEATIVTQYDLSKSQPESTDEEIKVLKQPEVVRYTIQLAASRKQIALTFFRDIEGIREVFSSDNYYRYISGEYSSVSKAKPDVAAFREAGFKDAFIREINSIPK
ncbi:MAG: OmpA family protein [Bacteroidia bacterium]|nr:OmpA family protein [Bacteroidia bacterium]